MSVSHISEVCPLLGASIDLLCCSFFNHWYHNWVSSISHSPPQEEHSTQLSQKHHLQPVPSVQHRKSLSVCHVPHKTITLPKDSTLCFIYTCSVILHAIDTILRMFARGVEKRLEVSAAISLRDYLFLSEMGLNKREAVSQWGVYTESQWLPWEKPVLLYIYEKAKWNIESRIKSWLDNTR